MAATSGVAVPNELGNKRQCATATTTGTHTAGGGSVSIADVKALLEQYNSNMSTTISTNVASLVTEEVTKRATECTANLVGALDAAYQTRFSSIENGVAAAHGRLNEQQAAIRELQNAVRTNADKQATLDTQTVAEVRTTLEEDAFTREPVPSVLKVNTSEKVDKKAVIETLDGLLAEARIDSAMVEISGPDVGKFFTVAFKGDLCTASRRAEKIFDMVCNAGKWRELHAGPARLYVDKDKSKQQSKTEAVGRLGKRYLSRLFPGDRRVHFDRKNGTLSVDWAPLCRVVVANTGVISYLWKERKVAELDFSKEDFTQALLSQPREDDSDPWSG
jgi:hypothetical protein